MVALTAVVETKTGLNQKTKKEKKKGIYKLNFKSLKIHRTWPYMVYILYMKKSKA